MNNKIDIYSIEKGCELLKEASHKLNQISNKMIYIKDYYTKDNLMADDITITDSINNCNNSINNTINCIEDYVEDMQLVLRQINMKDQVNNNE